MIWETSFGWREKKEKYGYTTDSLRNTGRKELYYDILWYVILPCDHWFSLISLLSRSLFDLSFSLELLSSSLWNRESKELASGWGSVCKRGKDKDQERITGRKIVIRWFVINILFPFPFLPWNREFDALSCFPFWFRAFFSLPYPLSLVSFFKLIKRKWSDF